jgi:hypothetical protein
MLPADETNNTGPAPKAPSAARRRLLQGGLATGPVLMTIASRPVLGQTVCTASASVSVIPVNSLNHAHAHVCEEAAGLSPERWKAMAPDWPSPYVAVVAPVVQDPASPTCEQTSAPAPTTTQTTTAPSAYDTYRTRRTQMYASRGLTTMGGGTTTVTPTTTTTPTTSTTCTSPTVAPASTQTTTTPSAYDAYRTQRAQLYANRGLTGLVSNPPVAAPTTTTSTLSAPSAPTTQSTYTTTSAATTTQTTTSSYTYRPRGSRSPYIQGGTSSTPTTTTGSTSTPVTSGPLVGPAGTNGTAFHCPTTGLNGQTFGSLTMLDVLGASGGAYDALGRYTVAALLNAKAGRVHVLPESTVRNMWNDCVTRGYYEPAAGVRWGAAEIVAYMQKTIA